MFFFPKKSFWLFLLIIFSCHAFASGLIVGGSFEDRNTQSGQPTYWGTGIVCQNDANSTGWSSAQSDYNTFNWWSTAGSWSVGCYTTAAGSGTFVAGGRQMGVCITRRYNSPLGMENCSTGVSSNVWNASIGSGVKNISNVPITTSVGTDWNLIITGVVGSIYYPAMVLPYAGTTSLSAGSVISFDLNFEADNVGLPTADDGQLTFIDNIRATGHTLDVTPPSSPQNSNTAFTITATVTDINGDNIVNADVNFGINNQIFQMTYSAGAYRYTHAGLSAGTYDYNVVSRWESVNQTHAGSLQFVTQEFQYLTFTPLSNIASWAYGSINIFPDDESDTIIFKVDSNSATTETATFNIYNSLTDGRQYFVYTSPDGNNYTFNDSLTYGSTDSNPVQKIWDNPNDRYTYSFSDTLTAGQTKYYKLTYKAPYKYYSYIKDSTDWANNLSPTLYSGGGNTVDRFTISNFSNIRSIFIENIPQISGSDVNAFELQFTAYSDINNTSILVGSTVYGSDSTATVSLSTTPHRYSFTVGSSNINAQMLIKSDNSSPAQIYIADYAIIPRAYFTKKLKILKTNGAVLDSILINGFSKQYLQEGTKFRIDSEAYDREGLLSYMDANAYFSSVSLSNLVAFETKYLYDVNSSESDREETLFSFTDDFNAIIDLNGNAITPATPRTLFITITLHDVNGFAVATQSQPIAFLQYPYFPNDLFMNFYPTEKRRGKNPTGVVQLNLKDGAVLNGLDLRIYSDTNTIELPNYRVNLYKNKDFTCIEGQCSFNLKINDWIFEDINKTTITLIALINTEYEDLNNYLTRIDRHIFVTPIEFSTAKLLQVNERPSNTYRNDEEIPLVLALKDAEANNLEGKINVYLNLQNCDSNNYLTANCLDQNTKYKPTGILYDDQTNITYYFFRQLFLLDSGDYLPDGNYISFKGFVNDATGVRESINPILTSRCTSSEFSVTNFVYTFLSSMVTNNWSTLITDLTATVCSANPTPDVVTTATNPSDKQFLRIDVDHNRTNPTFEGYICIAPDSNNIYSKPLEQSLLCYMSYTVGEKPIDAFRFRLSNNFSDFTIDDSNKQYVEYVVPYEIIAYADPILLKAELETSQNTRIDTIGEYIYEGFRRSGLIFVQNNDVFSYAEFIAGKGIIQNISGDFNFDKVFSAENVNGGFFIKIDKLPILNAQDYKYDGKINAEFDSIPRKRFIQYLATKRVSVTKQSSNLTVVTQSFASPYKIKGDGSILVDELPSSNTIKNTKVDINGISSQRNFSVPPTDIFITIAPTMFYNNFSENFTLSSILHLVVIIKQTAVASLLSLAEDLGTDPAGTFMGFIISNILSIGILLAIFFVLAITYYYFKGGG